MRREGGHQRHQRRAKDARAVVARRRLEARAPLLSRDAPIAIGIGEYKEEKEFIKNFSPYLSNENILNIVNKLEETIFAIRRNANSKILFFNLSLECLKLLTLKSN